MIFNLGGTDVTAEGIKYKDSNVGQALSVLEDELTANGQRIYLDYKDGKYGYNTDALRGADTFSPFSSGGGEFTKLTTKVDLAGNSLGTIYGNGYIILRKTWGNDNYDLDVYVDDNTEAFKLMPTEVGSLQGGYYRFYFQEKIRFGGDLSDHEYFYQTLLSETVLPKKYNITQGSKLGEDYLTFTGKGKILFSCLDVTSSIYFKIDGGEEQTMPMSSTQYSEYWFTKSISFKRMNTGALYPLYYLLYLEV